MHACGLAPADWALCRGLFAGELPRGIGIDVSGTVDAVGDGVTDVAVGDLVFGTADWRGGSTAGASDRAIMDHWFPVPTGLDATQAAALPMALDTAYRSLAQLGLSPGQTILIHGAGTTVGYAAVQIALIGGARVVATSGDTYAEQLRNLGVAVTAYGEGVVERVDAISDGPIDLVLDTAPVGGALPDFDVFPEFAQLAADGRLSVPIARTFPLDRWCSALEISLSGHARGKLLLLPGQARTVTA